MLDPYVRTLLLEHLRPPEDYELDYAIGTTYSLDLVALMLVPGAFINFDVDTNHLDRPDPVRLMAALKNYGDRLSIFCQGGGIHLPQSTNPWITFLEGSVFEVFAPNEGGVFHPKVWVLRFASSEGAVKYRVLCLSRNLTFDRSWDLALALEGDYRGRARGVPRNKPLCEFIAKLPGWRRAAPEDADGPQVAQMVENVARIAQELYYVKFELPSGFEDYAFHPLGMGNRNVSPFDNTRIDRLLVISPFLSDTQLRRLPGENNILVSQVDALAQLPDETLDRFSRVYMFNPAASPEEDDALRGSLSGLHAKLYVADAGWDASLWLGSANATSAAFKQNVEFLVKLSGKKRRCGIDSILCQNGMISFATLLQDYQPDGEPPEPAQDNADDTYRYEFARIPFSAAVVALAAESNNELHLIYPGAAIGAFRQKYHVQSIECWPVTSPDRRAALSDGGNLRFGPLALYELTGLFAFSIGVAGREYPTEFVLKCPVAGMPEQRNSTIFAQVLDSPQKVLEYLLFLLQDSRAIVSPSAEGGPEDTIVIGGRNSAPVRSITSMPLLELLMRALVRDRQKFDTVKRFIAEFERADLLPAGLAEIQTTLTEAYADLYEETDDEEAHDEEN